MHSAASEQDTSSWLVSDGLKEMELLLRAVLSHQSTPILIVDDDRVCLEASCGAAKLLGLSTGKMTGRRMSDFVKPDKLHYIEKSDVLPGRHVVILDGVSSAATDAAESADYALLALDAGGLIVAWHAGAERIYGYTSEETIGQHVSFLYLEDGGLRVQLHEELRRIALNGHLGNEGWHKKKDGSRFWANELTTAVRDGAEELLGFVRVVRDFSARHRIEETRLNKRAASRQLPPASTIAGIVSGEFDRIVDANDAFLGMVGYSREEFLAEGLQWADVVAPEFLPLHERAYEESLLQGACTPFEMEYVRRDETRVLVLVANAVLPPSPFRWITFVQDLTASERAEKIAEDPGASGEYEEIVGTSAALKRVLGGNLRAHRRHGAGVGRNRYRQGTGCARDSQDERSQESSLYHFELRRDSHRAARKRAVRL